MVRLFNSFFGFEVAQHKWNNLEGMKLRIKNDKIWMPFRVIEYWSLIKYNCILWGKRTWNLWKMTSKIAYSRWILIIKDEMSLRMTKPQNDLCALWGFWSAWASNQSDQSSLLSVESPWTQQTFVHGLWPPGILEQWSMANVQEVHFVPGQCPVSPWTILRESMDNDQWVQTRNIYLNGYEYINFKGGYFKSFLPNQHYNGPWQKFSHSMDSLDFVHGYCPVRLDSLDFVPGLTGLFPEYPRTLSRLSTDSKIEVRWVHGLTLSMDSLDFLQTGCLHEKKLGS